VLKIGEFSRLSHLTVKALRFYEKGGILLPASTDEWTGYRLYETAQLEAAASVKAYRQLGLSIDEIRAIQNGADVRQILSEKARALAEEKSRIDSRLSIIRHMLEDREMRHQVTEKTIPEMIVYSSETVLEHHMDIMRWIPSVGEECLRLNPGMRCADPPYEFCEFLDGEYRESDVRVRHSEAVTAAGKENDRITFRRLPAAKVLSVFHKGFYDIIGEAYAFIMRYAEQNGYKAAGPARECYIDGIWNKESEEDWLTEIQLPVE
jgi:Predicted transcriptional regulators